MSAYKVCPKCKINYSTLTKHRCFKVDPQTPPPKAPEAPPEGDGDVPATGGPSGQTDAEQASEGSNEHEAATSEGEGEGESEGDGQSEEVTAMEMVTLLRFAALSADSAAAFVTVEVAVEGLVIIGRDGERGKPFVVTVPWEDLAKVETRAAEDTILDAIKGVDYKVAGEDEPEAQQADEWLPWGGGEDPGKLPEGVATRYRRSSRASAE